MFPRPRRLPQQIHTAALIAPLFLPATATLFRTKRIVVAGHGFLLAADLLEECSLKSVSVVQKKSKRPSSVLLLIWLVPYRICNASCPRVHADCVTEQNVYNVLAGYLYWSSSQFLPALGTEPYSSLFLSRSIRAPILTPTIYRCTMSHLIVATLLPTIFGWKKLRKL